ncbi:MAG: NUDIX hydrolase [Thermonemataceae bacterium]
MHQSIEKLTHRLQQPLPGKAAQKKMAASSRQYDFSKYQPNRRTREGGVLLLLYPQQEEWYFPLIVRPTTEKGVHSGQIAFPGGKREPVDESIVTTALREGYEEVGIDRSSVQVLGQLSPLFVFASNFMVNPTIAYTPEKPVLTISDLEVAELLEVPLKQIESQLTPKETLIKTKQGLEIQAPYLDFEGKVIWGATAMMLNEFLTVWREVKKI